MPALVLGPYAKAEVIDTEFDHTSTLSHLQAMHEMPPLTLRNEHANDLFSPLTKIAWHGANPVLLPSSHPRGKP